MTEGGSAARPALDVGTRVEIKSSFDGSWSSGFVIESVDAEGYRVRRRSDGEVLPIAFSPDIVRREHRSMWWV